MGLLGALLRSFRTAGMLSRDPTLTSPTPEVGERTGDHAAALPGAQRRREVGIRLALGAQSGSVKRLFVYRGMMLSGVGIAIGVAVAAGVTRWMSSLLFGVTPVDAVTFAAAATVLTLAALAASYLPAHRAAAVDPVETLTGQ